MLRELVLVRLGQILNVLRLSAPPLVQRCDLYPMVRITANLAPGVSAAAAREQCESEAKTALPAGCRLTWMPALSVRE